jgi:hypothetical protein
MARARRSGAIVSLFCQAYFGLGGRNLWLEAIRYCVTESSDGIVDLCDGMNVIR